MPDSIVGPIYWQQIPGLLNNVLTFGGFGRSMTSKILDYSLNMLCSILNRVRILYKFFSVALGIVNKKNKTSIWRPTMLKANSN